MLAFDMTAWEDYLYFKDNVLIVASCRFHYGK